MSTSKVMTAKRRQKLQAATTALLAAIEAGKPPTAIISMLECDHGARARLDRSEMSLSCAGVRSTCTSGRQGLINNWRKAATLRLMAEG